jgi:hypothetical protein
VTGPALLGDGTPWLLGMAAAAIFLFVIAGWSGRWWLWLLAYTVTVLTLAAAFLVGPDFGTAPIPAPHTDPTPSERLEPVDPTARDHALDSLYWRTA